MFTVKNEQTNKKSSMLRSQGAPAGVFGAAFGEKKFCHKRSLQATEEDEEDSAAERRARAAGTKAEIPERVAKLRPRRRKQGGENLANRSPRV